MPKLDPSKTDRRADREALDQARAEWRAAREEALDDLLTGDAPTAARKRDLAQLRARARGPA